MQSHSNTPHIVARELKQDARGQWDFILSELAPEAAHALEKKGHHVPCPVHGGKDGYRLFSDFSQTGGCMCNTCGGSADGIAHLQWLKGWSFVQTLEAVASVIGHSPDSNVAPSARGANASGDSAESNEARQSREKKDQKLRDKLKSLWNESVPLTSPEAEPARLYLARRGLGFEVAFESLALSFHPSLPYYNKPKEGNRPAFLGNHPAILAIVCDRAGKPCTLHRTYLSEDGRKASVPMSKKLMPYPSDRSVSGGAIRLMKADKPALAVTEGIETALAVAEATEGVLPVWAAVSDTLLMQMVPPKHVKYVCLYGDQDRNGAGREALVQAKERLAKLGVKIAGYLPQGDIPKDQKGVDWLDIFNRQGPDAVPFPNSLSRLLTSNK